MAVAPVANDTTILASQYNALAAAIQDEDIGHAHTGATDGGKKISHADLTDGAMTVLSDTHTHAEIDDHIDAAQGQHSLNAAVYVAGVAGSQIVFQVGNASTDSSASLSAGWYDQTKTITFSTAFTSILGVNVIPRETDAAKVGVDTVSITGFRARIGFSDETKGKFVVSTAFYWLAWGTI